MLNAHIQPLYEEVGTLVTAHDPSQKITDLETLAVIDLFEKTGMILFRGFDISPQTLPAVTDTYTESYAVDAARRAKRFDQKIIRDVDVGAHAVLLHSEASFTPAWPELIWFLCMVPAQRDGATTVCDGVKAWQNLSERARNFFLLNPIRYELQVPLGQTKPGRGKRPWLFNTLGAGDATIDWDTGMIHLTQVRPAVTEGRTKNTLCFANHLIIHMDSENQLMKRTLLDGSNIPQDIMEEIHAVTESCTHEIAWQPRDLAMIDNKRLMHGRRAYKAGDKRDIVVIQSARASFGYGVTARKSINAA